MISEIQEIKIALPGETRAPSAIQDIFSNFLRLPRTINYDLWNRSIKLESKHIPGDP